MISPSILISKVGCVITAGGLASKSICQVGHRHQCCPALLDLSRNHRGPIGFTNEKCWFEEHVVVLGEFVPQNKEFVPLTAPTNAKSQWPKGCGSWFCSPGVWDHHRSSKVLEYLRSDSNRWQAGGCRVVSQLMGVITMVPGLHIPWLYPWTIPTAPLWGVRSGAYLMAAAFDFCASRGLNLVPIAAPWHNFDCRIPVFYLFLAAPDISNCFGGRKMLQIRQSNWGIQNVSRTPCHLLPDTQKTQSGSQSPVEVSLLRRIYKDGKL